MNHPKVSIILLNWNGWKNTIECLESLYQITYPNYDVIAIDNGSKDGSVKKIKEYCHGQMKIQSKFFEYNLNNKPIKIIEYTKGEAEAGGGKEKEFENSLSDKKLTIIKNEKNYGFAEGNNIGIRYAMKALTPNYVLLLNNDTAVDKEFLGELVNVGEAEDEIGIVGATVYHYDEQNSIQSAVEKICWNKGISNRSRSNEIIEVDYVWGCSLLAKRELFEKIGYLNQEYFAYWEDNDWCVRAHKAGFKVLYTPKAKIWHKSQSTSGEISGFEAYHQVRNRFWFMKQHATKGQYISFLLYFFGFSFWRTSYFYILYYKNITNFISFLRGVVDGCKGSGHGAHFIRNQA